MIELHIFVFTLGFEIRVFGWNFSSKCAHQNGAAAIAATHPTTIVHIFCVSTTNDIIFDILKAFGIIRRGLVATLNPSC